jgi:hypothetical protein
VARSLTSNRHSTRGLMKQFLWTKQPSEGEPDASRRNGEIG